MNFDRMAWLNRTLADANEDPDPPPGLKETVTVLAMLADEDGRVDTGTFEFAVGLELGALQPKWGPVMQLTEPGALA